MRVVRMAILLLASLPAPAEVPAWKLDLRERAERRADPVRNARHHEAFVARGQWIEVGNNVVDGSLDPEIFAPIGAWCAGTPRQRLLEPAPRHAGTSHCDRVRTVASVLWDVSEAPIPGQHPDPHQ